MPKPLFYTRNLLQNHVSHPNFLHTINKDKYDISALNIVKWQLELYLIDKCLLFVVYKNLYFKFI